MGFIGRWIARVTVSHPWRFVALGLIFCGFGGYYTAHLFMNLRPDLEELLPSNAPSVVSLGEIKRRLRSTDQLSILLMSEKGPIPYKAVEELVKELKKVPPDVIAGIEYRINREIEFFDRRGLLYMEHTDLSSIERYVREKIEYEKKLYNPLNIFSGEELFEPSIDIREIEKKYASQTGAFANFPDGYYATPDKKLFVILAHMPAGGNSISTAMKMREVVDQILADLNLQKHLPEMTIHFSGGAQDQIEEFTALVKDVGLATVIVILMTLAVVIGFFRSWRGTVALFSALSVGTLVCFGLSYFIVGYMNANSAFLGSIVIGNGINVGVIVLARYYEERRRGFGHLEAVETTIVKTSAATWTAALAAGFAYGSLMATSFRGFSQFGVIGLVGMVSCWVFTMVYLPVFLTLIYGRGNHPDFEKHPKRQFVTWIGRMIEQHAEKITLATFALTIASVAIVLTSREDMIETDLSKLRDKWSMEHGSGYYGKIAEKIFGRTLSPTVVMAHSRADSKKIRDRLIERRAKDGDKSLMLDIRSIDDFVPGEQDKKIGTVNAIDRLLSPRIRKALPAQDRKLVERFLVPEVFRGVGHTELPPVVLDKFTEKDGTIGNLVVIYPRLDSYKWTGVQLKEYADVIREVAASVDERAPVAGTLAVSADLISSLLTDGPRATAMAFLAVVFLVLLIFRNLRNSGFVLLSLVLGVAWLGAFITIFKIKINFMNFIALPITFGIGVDYGVNIFERYQQEGAARISRVIESTGGAVILASLTTIIGYGSLLLAGNLAFVSFGQIAIVGEVACLAAALISVPALLVTLNRRSTAKKVSSPGATTPTHAVHEKAQEPVPPSPAS